MKEKKLYVRPRGFLGTGMVLTRPFVITLIYFCIVCVPIILVIGMRSPIDNVITDFSFRVIINVFVLLISAIYVYLYFQQKYDQKVLRTQREQFNALKTVTQGSVEIRDLGHLLKIIPRFLMHTYLVKLGVKILHASVYFYDSVTQSYVLVAHRGVEEPVRKYLTNDDPLIFWFTKRAPYLVQKKYFKESDLEALRYEDIDHFLSIPKLAGHEPKLKDFLLELKDELLQLKASLCVPCFYQKECTGLLVLGGKDVGSYKQEEIDALITISNNIAIAIRANQLRQELSSSYLEAIQGIVKALEAKDPYTQGHSERVTWYSLAIVSELKEKSPYNQIPNLSEKIQQASLLHDVGKIGIRDDILASPSALSEEENFLKEQHPRISEYILSGLKGISAEVLQGILHHHERFDGKGYPDGLSSEKIPPIARILAVADTFDAMTTDRPYRKSISVKGTVKEIIKNTYYRGPQWDPQVVEAFLISLSKGRFKEGALLTEQQLEEIRFEIEKELNTELKPAQNFPQVFQNIKNIT